MQIDGISTALMPEQLTLLRDTIQEFKVTDFIELGLYRGGLAHYMLDLKKYHPGFHYFGFELYPHDLDASVRERPEIFILDAHGLEAATVIQSIIETAKGAVLIFCDTFDKPKGMMMYASVLRVGDLIMGHDYPGEVSDAFLTKYKREHPYLEEIRPEEYRGHGVSMWRKIEPTIG